MKRSIRKDKRDYINHLVSQAEEAAGQGNLKDLYLTTRKLVGKFQQTDIPVKDENVKPLTTVEKQLKRWTEYFRELLNCPAPELPDIPPAEIELPISCKKAHKSGDQEGHHDTEEWESGWARWIPAEAIKADI